MNGPAILKPDGKSFPGGKEKPPAEIKSMPLGDKDLVIIREKPGSKRKLTRHQVALMVQALKAHSPGWCGAVLCLEEDQGFEKMPEPVARKMYRILDKVVGTKSDDFTQLENALKNLPGDWKAGCPTEFVAVVEAAEKLTGFEG